MRLITWNTQWCRGLDGLVDPARIVREARALSDFDVLCLQEVAQGFDGMPGEPGDQPAQLQAALPGYACFYAPGVERIDSAGRTRRFGNWIATRLPAVAVEQHRLPWPVDPDVPSMPRVLLVVTLRAPGLGDVRVMTTHLEYYSAAQRLAQAHAIGELHAQASARAASPPKASDEDAAGPFAAHPHTPHAILCGDFNAGPADPACAALTASPSDLVDAWSLLHPGRPQPPTFRCHDQTWGREPVAFDFVFVSQTLSARVCDMRIEGLTQASDHQPVAIDLNADGA